jgi:hypothetical protein
MPKMINVELHLELGFRGAPLALSSGDVCAASWSTPDT